MYELMVFKDEEVLIRQKFEDRPSSADKQAAVEAAGGDFYKMGDYGCSVRKVKEE